MKRLRRAVSNVFGEGPRSSSGSTLLWMIGALVVLGAVAAGVSLMSPSASRGKLEQEAGMRAFYNANAGLQFLTSSNDAAEGAKLDFSNFTSRMGGTGLVTYTMPDNGTFSYQLGNIQTNGVNGTYQIANLYGTVQDKNNNSVYTYVLYGGGKGGSGVKGYTPSTEDVRPPFNNDGISGQTVKVAGYVGGSVLAENAEIQGGSNITGSLILTSTENGINISGGIKVATDDDSIICSNYGVYINGGSYVVNGNIYSPGTGSSAGYVTLNGGSVINGNIYANGVVRIDGGSRVYGEVNSQKSISIDGGSAIGKASQQGNALSNLTPTFTGGGLCYTDINSQEGIDLKNISISGDLHYKTLLQTEEYTTHWIKGTEDHNPTKPTAPSACEKYAQPTVPTFTASEPLHINGVMPPFTAGTYYYTYIDTTSWGTLVFDTSDGDINILVSGDVKISGNVYVKTAKDKSYKVITLTSSSAVAAAPYVYTYVGGSFELGGGTNWVGTVLADGDIKPSSATIVGSLHSINGVINPDKTWYNIEVVGLHD